jgi:hypothetical protein
MHRRMNPAVSRRLSHLNLLLGQAVQLIDQRVDLAVRGFDGPLD